MVWLVFVGLALVAIGVAVYPLFSRPPAEPPEPIAVPSPGPGKKRTRLFAAGVAAAAALLAGGAALYATVDFKPSSEAAGPSGNLAASSAEQLEKELKGAPTQAGYRRLANLRFAAGQYDKAVAADQRAIELGADDAVIWSEFGEAMVMAGDGSVPPQALGAFTNAISRDPTDARARYYIGLAQAQIGNLRQAVAIWRDLEGDADPDAPWLEMVRQHVVAFSKQGGFDPESVPPAAPSPSAMRAAVAAMTGAMDRSSSTTERK